tara:strand:- start:236 stop:3694 length:3459 start_codon:yes stop_codon:yes gene_type:complete
MINKEKFDNTGSLSEGTYYIESKKYPGKFLIIPQSDDGYYSIKKVENDESDDTDDTYHINTKEEKLGFLELKIGQHNGSKVQITESPTKHINFYIENTSEDERNETQTIYLLDNNTLTITNSTPKVLDDGKFGFTYQSNNDGSYVFKVKDYVKMVTNPTTTAEEPTTTAAASQTPGATQIPIDLVSSELNKYLSMDASNVPYYPVTDTKSHLGKVTIVDYITDSEKFYFYDKNHFPVVSFLFEKVDNYYYQNDEKYSRINKPKLYISNVVQGDELKLYNDSVGKLEIFYLDLVDKSRGLNNENYKNDIVKIAQNNKYWSIDKKGFIRCNTTKKNGTSFKLSEYNDNRSDKRQYYLQDIDTGNFLTINPEGELLMNYDHYKESKETQDNIDKRVILNLEPVEKYAILDMHDYADTEMNNINNNIKECINKTFNYLIYPRHYTIQERLEEHHVKQSKTEFLFDPERAYCFKKNSVYLSFIEYDENKEKTKKKIIDRDTKLKDMEVAQNELQSAQFDLDRKSTQLAEANIFMQNITDKMKKVKQYNLYFYGKLEETDEYISLKASLDEIEKKISDLKEKIEIKQNEVENKQIKVDELKRDTEYQEVDVFETKSELTNKFRFRIVQDEFGFYMFESLGYKDSKNVKGKYLKHKNDKIVGFEDYKSYDTDKNYLKTFKFDIKVNDTSADIYTYDIYTVDINPETKRYTSKSKIGNLGQINILPVSYEIYKYKPVDTTNTSDNSLLKEKRVNEDETLYIYRGISLNVDFTSGTDTNKKEFKHIEFFPRFKPEIYEGMRITGEDDSEFIGSLYKEHHKPLSLSKLIPENTKICVHPAMNFTYGTGQTKKIKSNKINNYYYKETTNLQAHYVERVDDDNNFTCKDIQKLNLLRLIEVDGNYIITSSTDLKYKKSVYKCPCDCFDTDVLDADKGLRKLNRFTKQGLNGVLNSVDGILSERTKDMTEIRTVVDGLLNRPLNTQFEIYETNNLIDTNPYSNKDEVDNYYREKAMEGYQNMLDDYDFDTMFNKDVIDLFKGEYKIFPGQFILLEDCKLIIDSNYVSINKYDYPIIKFQYNSTKRIESPYKNFLAIQFTIVNTDNRISDYETKQIIKLLETLGLKTPNYIYISKHGVQLDNDKMQIHYKFSDRQYSTLFQMYKIK